MEDIISRLFHRTAQTYGNMLDQFRPCRPGSEFLEQNLITLFCHEFLKEFPKGFAYTELPFRSKNSDNWGSRLDAYLTGGNVELLLEAKGSHSKTALFDLMEADLRRIHDPRLSNSIDEMAAGREGDSRNFKRPKRKFGLVIADCWTSNVAKQWDGDEPLVNSTQQEYLHLNNIKRSAISVRELGAYKYHLLCGWLELPACSVGN